MGELIPFRRAEVRPVARSFEDQRWAERHSVEPGVAEDMEARALRMGAVALVTLPKPVAAGATIVVCPAHGDCSCTAGTICRQNNACPRSASWLRT